MSSDTPRTDISDIHSLAELVHLAEEVHASKQPRVLTQGAEPLVIIQPAPPATSRQPRGRRLTKDDPLFGIIGIGHSEGPTDVSTNKHKYLSEAYYGKRE